MSFVKLLAQQWDKLGKAWQLALSSFFITRMTLGLWSVLVLILQPVAVHFFDTEAGDPGVVFFDLYTNEFHSFLRKEAGQILSFRVTGRGIVVDQQTNSTWLTTTGTAIEGPLTGYQLLPARYPEDMFPYHWAEPYPEPLLAVWQRFDTNWYTSIAENGYGSIPGDDHFPPLYPFLIRLILPIFKNAFIAGLVISHLTTLYSLKLLADLFISWSNPASAGKALLYLMLYPVSFYLFSAYTESVFLLATLLAFEQMKKQNWGWAGFWTFLAISTRLQGVALLPAMLYMIQRNDGPVLTRFRHWFGLGSAGTALAFYLFFRAVQIGDNPVPFSEPIWHAKLVLPWQTYVYAIRTIISGNFNYIDLLNFSIATLFVALLIFGWRQIPYEYSIYTAFSLLIVFIRIVETQPLISMSRYALALFPAFFTLSQIDSHPIGRRIVIYASLGLGLFLSSSFFSWGWVA